METEGHWIALLSGGKDSSWALYRALQDGLPVSHVVTATPRGDSYLFHVPALALCPYIAESIGLPIRTFPVEPPDSHDATVQGDQELAALREELLAIDRDIDAPLTGLVTGAVASEYQHNRLERLCAERNLDQFSPLWGCDPEATLRRMLDAGFDIRIVAVAAAGLDRTWLDRQLDETALGELLELHERHGIHVLGEGGEFETIVVDGPHMASPVRYEAEHHWDGTRGHLEIQNAWLET